MDGLLILAIESATECGSVSLSRGGFNDFRLLAECTAQPDTTPSRRLLGSMEWLLHCSGITWQAVDAVGVSMGPGSFTGLRTGMAAAKAVAMAIGKPLLGVPTLEALALGSGLRDCLACCLLDARKQEVYAAFYRLDGHGRPRLLGEPAVLPPAELLRNVDEPVVLVGPGVKRYGDAFAGSALVTFHPEYLSTPRSSHVGVLAAEKLARGEIDDPVTLAPCYVRASEAEINLRRITGH